MPYIGEIRVFGGNFPPLGWEFCEGQVLPISEYEVLFNLIGTAYGGDGQETFALPDLRGRVPVHAGNQLNIGQVLEPVLAPGTTPVVAGFTGSRGLKVTSTASVRVASAGVPRNMLAVRYIIATEGEFPAQN